ncbi:MAG TPA: hypothetical protein VIH45_10270 [Desulfuromonadaceae bacterium]
MNTLPHSYRTGIFSVPTTFYFSVGDIRKTVVLGAEGCTVQDGKTVDEADCICKTSAEMFARIWNDGYRPGIMDFMSGTIKSNAPQLLQQFMQAFGKS